MFIQNKSFLREIKRIRVAEGRNLDKGLRLDRNEKVDIWPKDFLLDVFSSKPECFLSVYPEITSLYMKLSKYLHVNEEQIAITSGIDGVIKVLFEILTSPGDTVGVLWPTYAMYEVYSNMYQVNLFKIGYNTDFTINIDSLNECLGKQPTILFIPNPNQPIESAFSIDELEDIAQKAYDKNCLLAIDEAYFMFGCDTGLRLIKEYGNVVILRTFSKAFGVPSIRLGYFVTNEENMEVLSKTRFAHESNSLSIAVAEYLLDNIDIVGKSVERVIEGRAYIKDKLTELNIQTHGSKGNFLLLDLQSNNKAKHIVSYLYDNFIYVKGPLPSPWDKYITISIGPKIEMQKLNDAFKIALKMYSSF